MEDSRRAIAAVLFGVCASQCQNSVVSDPENAEVPRGASPTDAEVVGASERERTTGGAGTSMIVGAVILGAISALLFSGVERLFAFMFGAPMGAVAGYRLWLSSKDD